MFQKQHAGVETGLEGRVREKAASESHSNLQIGGLAGRRFGKKLHSPLLMHAQRPGSTDCPGAMSAKPNPRSYPGEWSEDMIHHQSKSLMVEFGASHVG